MYKNANRKKYSSEKAAQISRSGDIKQLTVLATDVSMNLKCILPTPTWIPDRLHEHERHTGKKHV